jgi:DNA-binding NtrC family response regulator
MNHGLDMAAPLIGSTGAMRRLRATIERVACTDFTILLEGASDPQQKAKDLAFP